MATHLSPSKHCLKVNDLSAETQRDHSKSTEHVKLPSDISFNKQWTAESESGGILFH